MMKPRSRWRQLFHAFLGLFALVVGSGFLVALCVWDRWAGSLPVVEGTQRVAGLAGPVRIERDGLGVPTLHAANRADLAFATGYVHGQDRFFQMDLLRRHGAGELAELLGTPLLAEDRQVRIHRFRARARARLETLTPTDRDLLQHYAQGVEAGRASLRQVPFEYQLLRVTPAPWREEDTLLVAFNMFLLLQDGQGERDRTLGILASKLPGPLVDFLCPAGSSWDAPLDGSVVASPPLPGPGVIDLRKPQPWKPLSRQPLSLDWEEGAGRPHFGSNCWAVAGARTRHGGAILANDMHLMLMAPGIWYRAAFAYPGEDGQERRVVGLTLPGAPAMVVGSNGKVAWGFTNTEGDWSDRVVLEEDPAAPGCYRTPGGSRRIEEEAEVLHVRGGADVPLKVENTIWGPVIEKTPQGGRVALRWVAHDAEAINLDLLRMEAVNTVEEALELAPLVGSPAQNFLAADARGDVGWTILGRIPRRFGPGTDPDWASRPSSWSDGKRGWDGWLSPAEYPRIVNPPDGILWTANNRVLGPPAQRLIGATGFDLGARARQIRDDLRGRSDLTEADMLAIQRDNRGLLLERWRELMLKVLARKNDPDWERMRQAVLAGSDRADANSVGYRLVRGYRIMVHQILGEALTGEAQLVRGFALRDLPPAVEDSYWRVLTERPAHLLPPRHASWDEAMTDGVQRLRDRICGRGEDFEAALARFTWGERNRAAIAHPLHAALGPLGRWLGLDLPADPLPGDEANVPCILAPQFGASERLAVSPGHEEQGYLHLPAGQSGHPLSPHYRDGHAAWVQGQATPFLPGETRHVLVLEPAG